MRAKEADESLTPISELASDYVTNYDFYNLF